MDSMFDFAERFNKLQLTEGELALFSAVVLLSPGTYTSIIKWLCIIIDILSLMVYNFFIFASLLIEIADMDFVP